MCFRQVSAFHQIKVIIFPSLHFTEVWCEVGGRCLRRWRFLMPPPPPRYATDGRLMCTRRCMSVGVYLCISGTRQRAPQRRRPCSLTSPTPPFDLFLHRHCLFLALPVCAQLTVVVVPCECWVRNTEMVECHWLRLQCVCVCVCVCVCDVSQETEQTALDHSANMSTEIKLVYYFQRGEKKKQKKIFTKQKKQSYFTLVIIIKFFTTIQSA